MWWQPCFLILLCIPYIHPVNIKVDGSIDLEQNIGFKFTPDAQLLRYLNSTLPSEVSAIIDDITKTTRESLRTNKKKRKKHKTSKDVKKRAFRRRLDDAAYSLPDSDSDETTKNVIRKRLSTTQGLFIDIEALLEGLRSIARIRQVTEPRIDTYKFVTINSKKKMGHHKLKKKTTSFVTDTFVTEKSYNPSIIRITRQMDLDTYHSDKTDGKVKKSKHHKEHKSTSENTNPENKVTKKIKRHRKKTTADDSVYLPQKDNDNTYANEVPGEATTSWVFDQLLRNNDPVTPQVIDGQKLIELLEKFNIIKVETTTRSHFRMPTLVLTEDYYTHVPADDGDVLEKVHLVKKDKRLQNFTIHVFKQNIAVFEDIKSRVDDPKIKTKVNYLARSYRDRFGDYVKANQNQKVVTRLGTQKVVLNTIETSNHIMRRLLSFLLEDMNKKQTLRADDSIIWKNLVENEEQQEYVQACQKFNICRSKYSLSTFMADYFTVLLQVDDRKLRLAVDALTEVIKDTDLDTIMDSNMKKLIESNVDAMERAELHVVRPMIWMFRNMLLTKNQPLVVQEKVPKIVVSRSVALMDVIDILDEKIPASEENLLEWNDLINSLVQWANGQRNDIVEIMQSFMSMIVRKGVNKMNDNLKSVLRSKLKLFLRSPSNQ